MPEATETEAGDINVYSRVHNVLQPVAQFLWRSQVLLTIAVNCSLVLLTRAVQRLIHDAHGEDCFDAAEGEAMPRIGDIAHIIEAQDVGGE